MTTKPRAKKFRIRRSTPTAADALRRSAGEAEQPDAGQMFAPASTDDGFGDEPFPTSAAAQTPNRASVLAGANI